MTSGQRNLNQSFQDQVKFLLCIRPFTQSHMHEEQKDVSHLRSTLHLLSTDPSVYAVVVMRKSWRYPRSAVRDSCQLSFAARSNTCTKATCETLLYSMWEIFVCTLNYISTIKYTIILKLFFILFTIMEWVDSMNVNTIVVHASVHI